MSMREVTRLLNSWKRHPPACLGVQWWLSANGIDVTERKPRSCLLDESAARAFFAEGGTVNG